MIRATPVARGIAVLTDSDNTHSRAIGDYADIETLAPVPRSTAPIRPLITPYPLSGGKTHEEMAIRAFASHDPPPTLFFRVSRSACGD